MPGVVPDSVSFFRHSPDQFRFRIYVGSYHKKGGGYIVLLQCIQNGGCISVFISRIKSKIDHFLIGICRIICIVLRQFGGGGVPHRGLPLLLKAQTPVSFSGDGKGVVRTFPVQIKVFHRKSGSGAQGVHGDEKEQEMGGPGSQNMIFQKGEGSGQQDLFEKMFHDVVTGRAFVNSICGRKRENVIFRLFPSTRTMARLKTIS